MCLVQYTVHWKACQEQVAVHAECVPCNSGSKLNVRQWQLVGLLTGSGGLSRRVGAQSRSLEVRVRTPKLAGQEPKKDYVHMLNCTLTATERTLCCVLENYQTPDGVRYVLPPTWLPGILGHHRTPRQAKSRPPMISLELAWMLCRGLEGLP